MNHATGTNVARKPPPRLSTDEGYTAEEKTVLIHTSKINNHLFVPFMDMDVRDRFHFPMPFTDKVEIHFSSAHFSPLPPIKRLIQTIPSSFPSSGRFFGPGSQTKS